MVRKLKIYANIRFDSLLREQLNQLMNEIAPTGDKRWLSTRDKFFSYCNQRNVWYGSEKGFDQPYVKLEHKFSDEHQRIIDICKLYHFDIKQDVINSITQNKNQIYACSHVGTKIPIEVKGHLRAAGFNASCTSTSLTIQI